MIRSPPALITTQVPSVRSLKLSLAFLFATALAFPAAHAAAAQAVEPVLALAKKEKQPLLDTLKEIVSIETGSRDRENLDKLADIIAARLKTLGASVELIEPGPDIYKMHDTPEKIGKMVKGTFKGT